MSERLATQKRHSHDQRQFGRRKVLKGAQIILPSGNKLACFVVDISENGAGIRLPATQMLSGDFELLIEPDDVIVLCRIVHRTNDIVGVEYLRSPRIASRINTPASTQARRLAQFLYGDPPTK